MTDAGGVLPSAFAHLFDPRWPGHATGGVDDDALLARALVAAAQGVGRTAPNPPVGAVIAQDGVIVASGFHARAGEAHAEVAAIEAARGRSVRGATMAVTLEPCAHHGRTPPCADRLVDDGIGRVVVGVGDPNPAVDGKGLARLAAAGIPATVARGAVASFAAALIAPFTTRITARRPYVVVKVASSLDGRVAARTGHARFITGASSRALVHALRDHVDVVLTGSGTARADDPALTVRLDAPSRPPRHPVRALVDGALTVAPEARMFARHDDDKGAPIVFCRVDADPVARAALVERGVECLPVPGSASGPGLDLEAVLEALFARGHLTVLVEAGPGLVTALLARGFVDELWWMRAPTVLGADARPAVGPLALDRVDEAAPLDGASPPVVLGDDVLQVFRPRVWP